jgi:hypothetical protein
VSDEELEKLAKAATPGPWMYYERERQIVPPKMTDQHIAAAGQDNLSRDMAFIAACSPDRILSLLARVQRLEALEQLWRALEATAFVDDTGSTCQWSAAYQAFERAMRAGLADITTEQKP